MAKAHRGSKGGVGGLLAIKAEGVCRLVLPGVRACSRFDEGMLHFWMGRRMFPHWVGAGSKNGERWGARSWTMSPFWNCPTRWHHDFGGGGGILRPRGHIPRFWTGGWGCHRKSCFPPPLRIFFACVFLVCGDYGVCMGAGLAEGLGVRLFAFGGACMYAGVWGGWGVGGAAEGWGGR